ncbi:hypothetical protein KUTeg_021384 [Tegillarca granosa]|uniref:Caveolin n=1 Tax=Tegillarca granosa TaxID=220873 RepID=A0ABQ9EFP9_TEGGR|nr:hypothetical protein KUTeg_021384 [Tegillarca granosa]
MKMAEAVDLDQRDVNELNTHVKVMFEDVLAEPEGAHSPDCLWNFSHSCFNCGKTCCYNFLSSLCGLFIALAWGCEFGTVVFQHVWCYTPCLRIMAIYFVCFQKYFGTVISCCLAPLCESCGLFFSRINVYNHSQTNF